MGDEIPRGVHRPRGSSGLIGKLKSVLINKLSQPQVQYGIHIRVDADELWQEGSVQPAQMPHKRYQLWKWQETHCLSRSSPLSANDVYLVGDAVGISSLPLGRDVSATR